MVATSPSADFISHGVDGASLQKKITPFSIENILANAESPKETEDGRKNLLLPCLSSQLNSFPSWNQSLHFKLLANRLCMMNACQPFWLSDFHADSKLLSNCCRLFSPHRPHPYLDLRSRGKMVKSSFSWRPKENCKRSGSPKFTKPHLTPQTENVFKNLKKERSDLRSRSSSSSSSDNEEKFQKDRATSRSLGDENSPLNALERLTCATFKGMETKTHELHAVANGREAAKIKRRKCRTAFTAFQLSVLEQRFSCHKYLTPADRDQISLILGLSSAQVITWFQNRRAKQKRDLEEMKNDLKTVEKSLHQHNHDPQLA